MGLHHGVAAVGKKWQFLKKLINIGLPYDPEIQNNTKQLKTKIKTDTCTLELIVTLVTIAKRWQQQMTSAGERVKEVCYLHARGCYYSTTRGNERLMLAAIRMRLEKSQVK